MTRPRRGSRLGRLLLALAVAGPVAFVFRGLASGQSYAETWFYRLDPLFGDPAARAAPLPPRAAHVWDVSPAVLSSTADRFAAASLRRGDWPVWNPYQALGAPLVVETPLSPLRALLLYLPGVTDFTTSAMYAATVLLGAAGVVLWLRSAGLSTPAAAAAALPYVFAGNVLEGFRFLDLPAAMLAPMLLWRVERLLGRRRVVDVVALGALQAVVVLSSHATAAFLALAAAGLYLLVRVLLAPGRGGHRVHAIGLGLAAMALGAALSAPVWIALLELLREGWSYKLEEPGGLTCQAANLVRPHLYARCFLAASPLVLAAGGTLVRSRLRGPLVALVALGAALVYDPPLLGAVSRLPGLRHVQGIYAHFVLALGVAGLAAVGLDALPRRRLARALALASLAAALAVAIHPPAPWPLGAAPGTPAFVVEWIGSRLTIQLRAASAAATIALVLLAALRRVGRRWLAAGAYAACLLEVLPRAAVVVQPEPGFEFPESAALRFLRENVRPGERVAALTWSDSTFGFTAHTPNAGLVTGLSDPRGCQPVFVRRTHELLRLLDDSPGFPTWLLLRRHPDALADPDSRRPSGLELLGVRFLLGLPHSPVPEGHRRVYADAGVVVDEDPRALPRAFLVHRTRRAADAGEAAALLRGGALDFRREAVVEGAPALDGSGEAIEGESAALVSLEPRATRVAAVVRERALLVLSDAYYPGWRATVDGRDAAILPANLALRGVLLEPGRHDVAFRYAPSSLRLGLPLSGAALALAGLALARARPQAPRARS